MAMDIANMLRNPLSLSATQSDFFQLVLAECARFGVPGPALAMFRDLHAMLGHSAPLGHNQIAALAGPLVAWRTDPTQRHFERVHDVERLAYNQRALIAFGGGKPGEMVGRAEISHALGNMLLDRSPPEYLEVFQWASVDTLADIERVSKERVVKDREKDGWKLIPDEDVIQPGGRLYAAYQDICTSIRREAISGLEREPTGHPRAILRPFAAKALVEHTTVRESFAAKGETELVAHIDQQIGQLRQMFPDLGTIEQEVRRYNATIIKEIAERL
jgi:hypothetical protein